MEHEIHNMKIERLFRLKVIIIDIKLLVFTRCLEQQHYNSPTDRIDISNQQFERHFA
jgi:hypothetical protein